MASNVKNILYLVKIGRTLARHDALFFLDQLKFSPFVLKLANCSVFKNKQGRDGERLARALQELGPTFIKLGQALSVRSDIVGEEVAKDLSMLQDSLPPFSGDQAVEIIESELGASIDELFSEFDKNAIAAASIAQVHFAKNLDGNELAVKVLRPELEKKFSKDISFLYWVAKVFDKAVPKFKRLKLFEVVSTFHKSAKLEMDLRMEAAAASELQESLADCKYVKIPKIYWDKISQKVLVVERIHGININKKNELLAAGHDLSEVLTKASDLFFRQVFYNGYFHADMHPGNIFVGADGEIIIVDFGIMGRVDRKSRIFLAEILIGFLGRDYKKVADNHFDAGYVPNHQSRDLFAQACRSIGEPINGKPQNEISIATLLGQLFKISEDFEMETQPQLLLLQKTMVFAEGMARDLDSDVNFWELSKPMIEAWGKENLGVEAKIKDAACEVKNTIERMGSALKIVKNLSDSVTEDGIKLHPDVIESMKRRNSNNINLLWKVIFVSAIIAAIIVKIL